MVITLPAHTAVTPAGKLVAAPMPVAPVVAIVIFGAIAVFKHTVGLDDGAPAVLTSFTVIVPVAVTLPHPQIGRASCRDIAAAVGVPLMVITLPAQTDVIPAGK